MSQKQRLNPIIVIRLIIGLVMGTTIQVVKSEPNTSINECLCNNDSYSESDPYADSVAYVLADLMNVTPSQQEVYNYYANSPYATSVAHGHATCNQALANSDCANCLIAAKAALTSLCSGRIGAQVTMVDCSMRYENYGFW